MATQVVVWACANRYGSGRHKPHQPAREAEPGPANGRFLALVCLAIVGSPALLIHQSGVASAAAIAAGHTSGPLISGKEVAARVADGETVLLSGVIVVGDVDLRPIQTVSAPFRCLGCDIRGSFLAPDVIFQRIVDLTGTRVLGSLDVQGAVFRDVLLLRSTGGLRAQVDGSADFALTSFATRARFDGARFGGPADFTGVTFAQDSSFADSDFAASTTFELAIFGGAASFSATPAETNRSDPDPCAGTLGAFEGPARFVRVAFRGSVDFSQRCFGEDTDFRGASFADRLDLTLASLHGAARFDGATFQAGAMFVAATFSRGASFERITLGGSLDFGGASVAREISLADGAGAGSISLEGIKLTQRGSIRLTGLHVAALTMDIPTVEEVSGTGVREEVLSLIERTARVKGDIGEANSARYALLSLQGERARLPHRLADTVFYRAIAGYLVRPSHPLVAFLLLLVLGMTVRTLAALIGPRGGIIWDSNEVDEGAKPVGSSKPKRTRLVLLASSKSVTFVLSRLETTLRHALTKKADHARIEEKDRERLSAYFLAALLWVEFLGFKILIVLFLLGLGNSNSTIRQIIDAVRG